MAWDDFLVKVTDSSYKLADNTQVMEGTFHAKANGRNSILPDGSDKPIFVAERNSMSALEGDRVKFCMMARRRSHIREAQVMEIIERKKDQFVGKLDVEGDLDPDGFMGLADCRNGYQEIRFTHHFKTDEPQEKIDAFSQFIEDHCPVGDNLANGVKLIRVASIKE
jgi:exoribonuclease R